MHPLVQFLQAELQKIADPEKAKSMQAYQKATQKFFGVSAPERKAVLKESRNYWKLASFQEYETVIRELWTGNSREEMYLALDVALQYKKFRTDEAMPLFDYLVHTATNWDTLDLVAGNLVSNLVKQNRSHEKKLIEWRTSNNFWVRRASILAHLAHKEETNVELLEETIVMMIDEKEFFIRKAIGWVLRTYSRTDADWVEAFVDKYEDQLSGLSKREALKWLARQS